MIKQLRYLCTLLLMAVASVAWGDSWVITDAPSLKSGDVVVITGTNANGTYGMSNNNGTSSAPGATAVTIDGDKLSSSASVDNLQWTVTVGEINGERTYEFAAGSNKLYCTNTNNGVRVGTNDNKTFVFKDNYLYNSATSRYIGIYNNADWRCYTSINNNIKDQTFAFYKKTSDGKADANLSFSPSSVTIHVGETMPQITFSNPNNLDVVFVSSNNNVAVVSTDGTISLVNDGMGQAVITASSEETENYSLGNATCTINVLPIGGTLEDPLTVEEANIFISTLENKVNSEYVYVRGIVSALGEFSSEYGNYVYYISDDGTETNQLEVYRGKYLENANFTSANQLTVGDKVIVYGPLVNFNGTYEFTTGNYIYAFENNLAKCDLSFDKTAVSVELNSEFTAPTLNNPHELSVSYSSSNTDVATVDVTTGDVTIIAIGETTITASFAGNDSYEEGSASYVLTVTDPSAAGSKANPYTVAEARAAIDAGSGVTGVYVKGKVSKIVTAYSEQFGNISYNISDDGTETAAQLQAFRGKSYEGANFTSADDIKVGDEVVVYGNLTLYKETYEFDADNQLVSLTRPETPVTVNLPVFEPAAGEVEAGTEITISEGDAEFCVYTTDDTDPTYVDGEITNGTRIDATEKIAINADVTIKAIAVDAEGNVSAVATAIYTIKAETQAEDVVIVEEDKTTFLFNTEGNEWGFPEGSTNKTTEERSYTYTDKNGNDYEIILSGGGTNNGHYYNKTNKYLLMGKSGAILTLPAFDFPVGIIEITGNKNASESVKQNIFVGNDAVSTETTGAGTNDAPIVNTYVINKDYQAVGNVYTLKVTSSHNTQITQIVVYKATGNEKADPQLKFSDTSATATLGSDFVAPELTYAEGFNETVTFESSNPEVATVDTNTGAVTLVGVGETVITATSGATANYLAGEASYTLIVKDPNALEAMFNFDDDYATLFSLEGTSSSESNAGDITEDVTAEVDGIQLTVSAAAEGATTPNRIWNSSPRLRMYSGTLTVAAPAGYLITGLEFNENAKWNDGNAADSGTLTNKGWAGEAQTVVITIAANTQLKYLNVLYKKADSAKVGDVNKDGDVTIADVTALVNIILNKETAEGTYDHVAADVDGANGITVADVEALVNIILEKTN